MLRIYPVCLTMVREVAVVLERVPDKDLCRQLRRASMSVVLNVAEASAYATATAYPSATAYAHASAYAHATAYAHAPTLPLSNLSTEALIAELAKWGTRKDRCPAAIEESLELLRPTPSLNIQASGNSLFPKQIRCSWPAPSLRRNSLG